METPHNVKLFRTLSMVRQNPQKQTKRKKNYSTGNTTWNPPKCQKKKKIDICPLFQSFAGYLPSHSSPNYAITRLN